MSCMLSLCTQQVAPWLALAAHVMILLLMQILSATSSPQAFCVPWQCAFHQPLATRRGPTGRFDTLSQHYAVLS